LEHRVNPKLPTGKISEPAFPRGASPPVPPYALSAEKILERFEVDAARGLDEAVVAEQRTRFGFNELTAAPPIPWWRKFLAQFEELVVGILIAAAVIAGLSGDWTDTFVILAIVLLNAIIGYLQEEKAERALAALQQLSAPMAKVLRGGVLQAVPARELVPGDRIELEAGDNAPADARLIEAFGIRVQEAALTGESVPVEKRSDSILPENTALGDRKNMVYMSTIVTAGKARAVVAATGMETELGRIAGLLQREKREPTPLQRRLAELGRILVIVCLAIVAVIFALELYRGRGLGDVFVRAISLAVAAVPEGLPAVVTLALALGLQRMVARNVLIRRLPSVETLGSVTVICSDKTGTLTRNEMTVRVIVAGNRWYRVTGTGYAPEGEFVSGSPGGEQLDAGTAVDPHQTPDLLRALTIGLRCNGARVARSGEEGEGWKVIGDPTEGALVVAAMKARLEPASDRPLFELPFDSDRKAMSVVYSVTDGGSEMFTKGAPEVILRSCTAELMNGEVTPLTDPRRREIGEANSQLAAKALRVLALAHRTYAHTDAEQFVESEMVFCGLVGMIDPPRDEVKVAVARARAAGIRPVMITGDHPETASAIARELHLAGADDRTLSGHDLDNLTDDELARDVHHIAVYARVSPEHKLRVVRAWKSRGEVVAMTGDGVNDAPAVKAADIGIAMGITGTDVTKEASDMVLTDDNFTSIVNAVEEGRGIFDNIQKFVHYLLSCNAGEVLLMFFAVLVGWHAPLEAIQILWINLVTDGLPALALAMEHPERGIMRRPPRPPHESVITPRHGVLIGFHGLLIAAASAAGFGVVYHGPGDHSLERAQTVAFCIMSYSQLFFAIGCRSHTRTLPELGLFSNPHLLGAIVISGLLQLGVVSFPFAQSMFETTSLSGHEWLVVLGLALVPVTVIEIVKLVLSAIRRSDANYPHRQDLHDEVRR
jgi:P-type Ca2+ transporter type 2C